MLAKFRSLFMIKLHNCIECSKCRQKSENEEGMFVFDPPLGDFATEWTDTRTFDCATCKMHNVGQPFRHNITVFPDIFIVQLTRFSEDQSKDLKQYPIPRRLKEHYLAGFISHVGT